MSKVRRRLEKSLSDGRIATVVRDKFDITMTDGFVVALTDDWVVMHDLDSGVYVDCIVMLRLRDVSRVLFRDDNAYHHRGVAGLNQQVAAFEVENSVGVPDLLSAASSLADIFAIHSEVLDGEPLLVGRLGALRRKSFKFHFVGRDGVWACDVDKIKYRDVTRIEVGGRYLAALNRFADPYPVAADTDLDASVGVTGTSA